MAKWLRFAQILMVLLLVAAAAPSLLFAQGGDTPFRIAPALTGRDGKVLIGIARGVIYKSSVRPTGSMTLEDSIKAGQAGLPDSLDGVWHFSMPRSGDKNYVIGLASYRDAGTKKFCLIESNDFGTSWTFKTPAALADPNYLVTTSFWFQGLSQMFWLNDGMHGWIYGKRGIVRTTNAGETWDTLLTTVAPADGFISSQIGVWSLSFKDSQNGTMSFGVPGLQHYNYTQDGGKTWTEWNGSAPAPTRSLQIDHVGNFYRGFAFDRFATNTVRGFYMYSSTDEGKTWKSQTCNGMIREPSQMSEIMWLGVNVAFAVQRSGDIFQTTNGGANWTKIQVADSVAYPIPVGPSTAWGQKTILMKDQLGNNVMVHASTLDPQGNIYRLLQWFIQSIPADAPIDPTFAEELHLNTYPNPAIGTSELQFQLPAPEAGIVVVVDPLGREVLRRDLGLMNAGQQQVPLDVAGLPAGMYRYVLQIGERRAGGSLVVAR